MLEEHPECLVQIIACAAAKIKDWKSPYVCCHSGRSTKRSNYFHKLSKIKFLEGPTWGIPSSESSLSPHLSWAVVLLLSCGTAVESGLWIFISIWIFDVYGEAGSHAWRVVFTAISVSCQWETWCLYNHQQTITSSHSVLQLSAASSSVTQAKGILWLCLPGKCLLAYGEEWLWVRLSRTEISHQYFENRMDCSVLISEAFFFFLFIFLIKKTSIVWMNSA